MEKKIQHTERRGLPGGPNEMFSYTTGVFSTEGFRMDSPDVNNYQNIIPSGSITMTERDGSPLRKGPIHGLDNLGNEQIMYPGYNYEFPGTEVTETLMAKMGGALLDKTIKCGNCGWEWKAADGGSDLYDCHKCKGGKGVIKAQVGVEIKPRPSFKNFLESIKKDKTIDLKEKPREVVVESTKTVLPQTPKKLTKQQAKIVQEDLYKNPIKREGLTSGDETVDFLYNNEWLMDVPIVGDYIKDKAKEIAQDSGGREIVDDIEKKVVDSAFTDEFDNYTGNFNFKNERPTLVDQYFSKDPLLPKSKYKPKDDYLEFLPSYSIKGDIDKDAEKIEQLNYLIPNEILDSKYNEFLKNKKPIYLNQEKNIGMHGVLGTDLGSYKTGIAWDDKMNLPYISVSDAWDFEPSAYSKKWTDENAPKEKTDQAFIQSYLMHKAGNPFKVYDRFYFDPKTKKYIPDNQLGNYEEGGESLIKAQLGKEKKSLGAGKYNTTTGKVVDWGTPEYEAAYNRGEVLSEDGVPSEVTMQGGTLPELVLQNNYKKGFLEKYRDKIVEENKDAGLLGAIIGTPISAVTSLPQLAATYAITGKVERPSEAMNIQNPYGAMAVDAFLDPANAVGVGELTALGRLTKEQALAKLAKIPTSIAPELRQGLRKQGLYFKDIKMDYEKINPKLKDIGTEVDYDSYLNENFLNSDVLYSGTNNYQDILEKGFDYDKINRYNRGYGINASPNKTVAGSYGDNILTILQEKSSNIHDLLPGVEGSLNLNDDQVKYLYNKFGLEGKVPYEDYYKEVKNKSVHRLVDNMKLKGFSSKDIIQSFKDMNIDATKGAVSGGGDVTVLTNPEKFNILGDSQDLERFQNYINNNKEKIVHTLDELQITPQDEIQDLHNNLLNRFNTEEGKRRLGLLGIDNSKLNPPELSFKSTGSGYYPSINTMDIDLEEAAKLGMDPLTVYQHETGHWLTKQYGDQSPTLLRQKFYESPIDNEFRSSYPENFANELLAKNPNVDFDKISKESSAAYMLNQKDEAFPFLREMRQNMLNKGYINDEYDDISQETINKFIKENPDDRISSFTEPNSKQSKVIYELFKNLPAVVPAAIGVSALQQQAKGGESKSGPLMKAYNRLPAEKKMGGSVDYKQVGGEKKYSEQDGKIIVTTKKVNTIDGPRYYQAKSPNYNFSKELVDAKSITRVADSIPKANLDIRIIEALNKKQFGGQLNASNITMYRDYIKGNIQNETEAIKNYDKLNRVYYNEAKESGMTVANYIMTHIVGNS